MSYLDIQWNLSVACSLNCYSLHWQVTEELEGVKAEMDEKGTSMTDAGPLVRVKQALTRLKTECTQMDVRIGVVSGMCL